MIPRLIHHVWVGQQPKPAVVLKCMESWRRHLAGYRITQWNEENFDMGCSQYLREAYAAGKWAFVSDYIRMHVVHAHGGTYLDSDCYVRGSLTPFMRHAFFSGFEVDAAPFTAVFGAEPGHPIVKRILRHYDAHPFVLPDGTHDTTTNTLLVGRILREEYGCVPNGSYQELRDGAAIYPADVLCRLSGKSVVVHLMNGSWENEPARNRFLIRMLGGRASATLFRIRHKYIYDLLDLLACFYRRSRPSVPAASASDPAQSEK